MVASFAVRKFFNFRHLAILVSVASSVRVAGTTALAARPAHQPTADVAGLDSFQPERLIAAVRAVVSRIVATLSEDELRARVQQEVLSDDFEEFLEQAEVLWPLLSNVELPSFDDDGDEDELEPLFLVVLDLSVTLFAQTLSTQDGAATRPGDPGPNDGHVPETAGVVEDEEAELVGVQELLYGHRIAPEIQDALAEGLAGYTCLLVLFDEEHEIAPWQRSVLRDVARTGLTKYLSFLIAAVADIGGEFPKSPLVASVQPLDLAAIADAHARRAAAFDRYVDHSIAESSGRG